ncbi:RNA polymerase sigma factor [Pigmentiphaga aceris]|uniref:RNA polymerase sigma factor n=1 Tax=Pigmentiphaga aceris TaxID=1940612 RepID=A0A5C0B3S4_9BURK|nr:RNA polymerase sigma factor [Pigmentiphaga aceris]QEI07890.1 RNA polymerase sigma factor [Pigmentiphaga aceris]
MLTRYYRDLLNFCLRKARDRDTAADLAQESFARVLKMQQAGQAILSPAALLRQVATTAKIDLDRRTAVRQADSLDDLDDLSHPAGPRHLQPEEAYASSQAVQAYLQAIDTLPPRCREAFSLYVFDGLSKQEIADRMGVSLSMVKQYVTRAKAVCETCRQALAATENADKPKP